MNNTEINPKTDTDVREQIKQARRDGTIAAWCAANPDRDPDTGQKIDMAWFHEQFRDYVFGIVAAAQNDVLNEGYFLKEGGTRALAAVDAMHPAVLQTAALGQYLPAVELPALDTLIPGAEPLTPEVATLREYLATSLTLLRAERLIEFYGDIYFRQPDDLYAAKFANWLDAAPDMRRRWDALGLSLDAVTDPAESAE